MPDSGDCVGYIGGGTCKLEAREEAVRRLYCATRAAINASLILALVLTHVVVSHTTRSIVAAFVVCLIVCFDDVFDCLLLLSW